MSSAPGQVIANPVVRGVSPDPSVCRVGEDFYLATSTFDHWPGVRIRHSTNLVDWRIIGAAVTRPAQYRRDGRPGALMLFAPTLRHHEGRFYLACTNVADGQGNFVVHTSEPAGEWSDAVWIDADAFDPSLLFADTTCYYTRRTLAPRPDGRLGPVVQAELDPLTGRLLGPLRELTPDYGGFCTNDIEGPHLYKIGDWYYLFSAEGGSWKGHLQSCARSRSPWGPFEPCPHNPVLTHRHRVGHPVQTVGHAELVDDPDGSWWSVNLGTRHHAHGGFVYHHNLGRETFLAPVTWTDEGWPLIGRDGTLELDLDAGRPLPAGPARAYPAPTVWTAGWSTLGLPASGVAGDPECGTYLLPYGTGLDGDPAAGGIGALLRPQPEDDGTVSVVLDDPPVAPARAGLAMYTDRQHHFSLLAHRIPSGARLVTLRRRVDDLLTEQIVELPGDGPVALSVTAGEPRYVFAAGDPGSPTVEVGKGSARLLSAEAAESFVGCHVTLVAEGDPAVDPASFSGMIADWVRP